MALITLSTEIKAQLDITQNTTWSVSNPPPAITGDIVIKPYITLTIQSGVLLEMPNYSSIKLQEGAKLNTNGATIKQQCNDWYGISAEGQGNTISQYSSQQPKINLVNTNIEKMTSGISTNGGGVIRLYNCVLTDCKIGVSIQNYVYYDAGVVKNDFSFIKKSIFTNSITTNSQAGVYINNVVGIKILGCQFDHILRDRCKGN